MQALLEGSADRYPGAPTDEPAPRALWETAGAGVLDPYLFDYVFHPELHGLSARPSASEVVDRALSWPAGVVSMEVTRVDDQEATAWRVAWTAAEGLQALCLFPAGPPLRVGMRLAVALAGATLRDGTLVRRRQGPQLTVTGSPVAIVTEPPGLDLTEAFGVRRGAPLVHATRGRELGFWGPHPGLTPVGARRLHRWLLQGDWSILPTRRPTAPFLDAVRAQLPGLQGHLARPPVGFEGYALLALAEPADDEFVEALIAIAGEAGLVAWDAGAQTLWEPGSFIGARAGATG